jgi:large subunit ribosomal protein L5
MTRLEEKYRNEILPRLFERAGTTNPMAVPRLGKVVISMGVGAALVDKKRLESSARDLAIIAGQKPQVCKARKSVSNFKVRAGYETGLKVTLRGARMYEFLDRLIAVAIPRIRDFRGLNPQSFDGRGNYSMGVNEQSIFPEIDPAGIEWNQGMNITIVTTARNDQDSRELLNLIGMPFQKDDQDGKGRA